MSALNQISAKPDRPANRKPRHCEEQGDEAIQLLPAGWIASALRASQ
jgi:hypothetical protein